MAKWSDALNVIAKAAPMIGAAAGGPLVGTAISALEKTFGMNGGGDMATRQDALATAVAGASAEQLFAMKRADNDFAAKMAELGFKDAEALAGLSAADRDSARKREMTVRDWTPRILAYAITAGFFGMLGWMMSSEVPQSSKDILNVMLGALGTAWISVISFYFGSSAASDRKTELLAKAQPIA
jgi:hypothetical protein